MSDDNTGDAWRYASNLDDPAAVRALLQAALTAYGTITFARKNCAGADFETVPDWPRVQLELRAALKAAGHPAGDKP
jgi:hypothetical protein